MPLITQGANALEMVARYGSIRKAAERMNATPSAVNRQILNLELEYGQPLFERLPRGMRPTEAGRVLIGQVRKWRQDLLGASEQLDGLRPYGGRVRVGIMECLASGFLPAVFRKLRQRHPKAALHAVVGGTDGILAKIKDGEIDLAVTFNTPHDSEVSIVHTATLPLGIVVPPTHALASKAFATIDDIQDQDFLITDDSLTIGPLSEMIIERLRAPVQRIAVTNSIAFLKAMVQEGLGLSMLTMIDVQDDVATGKLCFVPMVGARMSSPLSLSARDVRALTEVGKTASEIIATSLDELGTLAERVVNLREFDRTTR